MEILINRGGQQTGPFSLEDIKRQLAKGTIIAADLAWHEGMSEWKPVHVLIAENDGKKPAGLVAPSVGAAGAGGTVILNRADLDKQHENLKPPPTVEPVKQVERKDLSRFALPLLLMCVWIGLACWALSRGDISRAVIYLAIGGALTAWRITKVSG